MNLGELYGLHAQKRIFCARPECIDLGDCAHRVDGRPCWSQLGTMAMAHEVPEPVPTQVRNDLLLDTASAPEREWTYVDLVERW